MNPTILTVIIAASAFILSLFAASWLNLRNTDKLFERLDKQLAAQFGEVRAEFAAVRAEMATLRTEMSAEFAAVRAEMATLRAEMRAEIAAIHPRLDALEDKVDRLDRQMEAIFKPILPKS